MATGTVRDFNSDRLRPGQQPAIETIIQRVSAGESHTSIVLPTRYGKTDVMRIAGNLLLANRTVSRCFILEPSAYLVGQVASRDKMDETISFYGLPLREISVFPMKDNFSLEELIVDRADFTVMTIQMATMNTRNRVLQEVVRHEINKKQGPPLVFIDEAHTGSRENRWGECAEALSTAGAALVLLTATPYRADRIPLYGFSYSEENVSPVRIRRPNDADSDLVDVYEGYKTVYKLKADFTYTFRQAWREQPPPICFITRRAFDIDMEMFDADTDEYIGDRMLSDLREHEARRKLGEIVRHPVVIEQGVKTFLDELLDFRSKVAAKAKGIVFVGNDRDVEAESNEHALRVSEAIARFATGLKVDIATSSIGSGAVEAQEKISQFAQGKGADVLIVKQMGGVGLDVPSLKVCLDLSPVRTGPQFVQRMMRIATVWPQGRDNAVFTAHYVTPDDILSRALFQTFVLEEGGGATMTNVDYVETYRKSGLGWPPPLDIDYAPVQGHEGAILSDTEGLEAPSVEALPFVRYATEHEPRLKLALTDPQIFALKEVIENYQSEQSGQPPSASTGEPSQVQDTIRSGNGRGARDIRADKKHLRDSINATVRSIVSIENPGVSQAVWVDLLRESMIHLKTDRCRLPYKELKDYSQAQLQRLDEEAKQWLSEMKR